MSNEINTKLLERAAEAIDSAHEHIERWSSTYYEKVLDECRAQVIKHIDDNNLEDLYAISLPRLEDKLKESANALEAQEAFNTEYDPEGAQEAAEVLRDQLREDGIPF